MQIGSATDKKQQIQKLNSILEKEQGMKKIMAKDNIELKVHIPVCSACVGIGNTLVAFKTN